MIYGMNLAAIINPNFIPKSLNFIPKSLSIHGCWVMLFLNPDFQELKHTRGKLAVLYSTEWLDSRATKGSRNQVKVGSPGNSVCNQRRDDDPIVTCAKLFQSLRSTSLRCQSMDGLYLITCVVT